MLPLILAGLIWSQASPALASTTDAPFRQEHGEISLPELIDGEIELRYRRPQGQTDTEVPPLSSASRGR